MQNTELPLKTDREHSVRVKRAAKIVRQEIARYRADIAGRRSNLFPQAPIVEIAQEQEQTF